MHMHAHTETDAHTNTCTYMHMICTYTHTHKHSYTHTCKHTHTHTHRRAHLVRQSRPSYMWCDDNIRMRPQFTASWQRFLTEHIQYGTTNPPLSDRTDTQGMDCECLTVHSIMHGLWMSNSSFYNAIGSWPHIQYGTTIGHRTDRQGMDCDHRVGMSNSSLCNATSSLLLTTHQCGTTNHLSQTGQTDQTQSVSTAWECLAQFTQYIFSFSDDVKFSGSECDF